ncbi:hypothetical protein GE061_000230 [Apolygus lucorum]|uniref:Secreted protein n=1 Tax=Apolygus lucorum TaxID=248454 RepID=A0A8S9Y7T5_APOLU|nr:hypothetical protein GE061_000230 [Apolygus lucorum]
MKTFGIQVTLIVLLAAVAVLSSPLSGDGEKGKPEGHKVVANSAMEHTHEETRETPEVIEAIQHREKREQNPWGRGGGCPPCACGGGGWGDSNPNRG